MLESALQKIYAHTQCRGGMNVGREEWGIKDLRPEKCFQVNPLGNENPATVAPFSRSLTPNDSIEMSDYTERNSRRILYLPRERTKLLTNNIYLKRTYDLHHPRYFKIMATRGFRFLSIANIIAPPNAHM